MKIFVDANILVAACGNPVGGSAYLFQVAQQDATWHIVTSALAIQEARVNVQKKLLDRLATFQKLVTASTLTIVHAPPVVMNQAAEKIINPKDAPILAAAICTQANYLCTLDKMDFHTPKVKRWCANYGLQIVTPGDLLIQWRNENRR